MTRRKLKHSPGSAFATAMWKAATARVSKLRRASMSATEIGNTAMACHFAEKAGEAGRVADHWAREAGRRLNEANGIGSSRARAEEM